jgi:general stress protein YciG
LWSAEPDGYRFRDWFDYQPTAEKSAEIKEKRREAGRKGGMASGHARAEAEGNQT